MKKRKKAVRLPYLVLVPFAASVCLVIWMIFSGALMSTDEATQSLGGIFDGTSAVHWPLIPNSPTLQPLIEVLLDTPEFFVMFWNTCILTFPQLIGQFLFASPAAWAFSRFTFRGRNLLFTIYYPIYSEGKLSERKQLFHLSLRNRLPALRQTPISESDTDSQNDERQALKRIVVFFAVMLILTLVARGTSSAIRPVVTTQQAKAGTISQSVQSSGSITASSVLSVSLPEGIVLDNILVKEGQSVVEGQTLATCDVDELSTKLDRAKASLQKSKAEYNQLLSNAVLDDTSVARTQQALLRAYEADQKAYEELEKLRAFPWRR